MFFDPQSSIAIREREDGLLEKDTFDLSSAVPVDNPKDMTISSPKEPFRYTPPLTDAQKAEAVVSQVYKDAGKKVPFMTQADWVLTSPQVTVPEKNILGYLVALASGWGVIESATIPAYNALKGIADASSPNSDVGKMIFDSAYKGLAENDKIQNLGGSAAKAYPNAPWVLTGTMGAVAETLMFMPGLAEKTLSKLSKSEQYAMALNRFRSTPKYGDLITSIAEKTNIPVEQVDSAIYRKAWSLKDETNYFKVLNENLKSISGVDLFSETGSIPIGKAKIGQKINFTDNQGLVKSGEIVEDLSALGKTGERFGIKLDSEQGRTIVAMANQLDLPEAQEMFNNVSEQEPPLPPKPTAISGTPEEIPIIKNLNIPEESKKNIQNLAEQTMPDLEKLKGKPLTHDEVVEAAASSDILTQVINRSESKEVEAALLRTRQHLASMAEQQGISEDFVKTLKIVKSFASDTARKLGSLRIEAGANEFNIKTKIANELTDMGVELSRIIEESKGIDFNNQEQVTQFYRKFVKPKLWDLINEYRYINLLSSPKTHIVNLFSNLLQVSGLAPATKLASGAIDSIHAMLKPGLERTHYIKEVPAYVKGAINSIGEAGSKALDALKGKSFVERPDVKHIPTGSRLLKPFRYIPQALEASDVFFRTIAYQGELEAQLAKGIERSKAEKIAKEKASYWVFRKASDPSNKTGQGVLLSSIDSLTSQIYKLRSIPVLGRVISWYIPFVQTPMNIAKQMIEYSPLGVTTIKGAKDKTEQAAKMLVGSFITATSAYLIAQNDSTWEMPTSKKEKELFIASGKTPFSIKLGDKWYSYSRLGPIGFPIAIAAASKWYLSENPSAATDSAMLKASKVIGGLGNFFASQSYVQGITDLMNTIKNAPGALSKLVSNVPSQLIPVSSFQRWVNNYILDPVYRKAEKDLSLESILDNAKSSLIGMTKGMPAYQNIDEEDSKRNLPILNAFSPVSISQAKNDSEYKDYLATKIENLISKQESGDEPKSRATRGRPRRRRQ